MTPEEKRLARSAARLYAVQALFQMEAAGGAYDRIVREFESHRFGMPQDGMELPDGHIDHFRKIVSEAVNRQAQIDQLTDRALVSKWPIDRIDPTLRAVFRAAGAELVSTDTPPRVIITEYLRVAEAFYPDEEPDPETGRPAPPRRERAFVNAVLDHMARAAKPQAFGPA